MSHRFTIARGDGIGPEIMEATLKILEKSGFSFDVDEIKIGKAVYEQGHTSGIAPESWETITRNKLFLKAPITTPQGKGYKSLNVTIRKTLGLFANVRPVRSYYPFVNTKHPKMDMVIIRENEEDLYAGIEHRQTQEVYQCLKLITRPGSEKIIRYAFEYAKVMGRKKVTCMSKDNIMKLTDGLFHKIFDDVKTEYPEIETEHMIIDIGSAKLAAVPENFDVVVTANLYGDIVSDIVAEISGSVGLAGSSNIGMNCSMFEAIHGSAPDISGQGIANPSGLMFGACQMLQHLGENETAARIENAWLKTIEDGVATADIYSSESKKKVKTQEFAEEVISRLGEQPKTLSPKKISSQAQRIQLTLKEPKPQERSLDGVDIFIYQENRDPNVLGEALKQASKDSPLELVMITNRGVKVYPDGNPETFCTDHWRCRFMGEGAKPQHLWPLMSAISSSKLDIIKTENLYSFDNEPGYSKGQGQ
jgi:isocitrate dehydrogenase